MKVSRIMQFNSLIIAVTVSTLFCTNCTGPHTSSSKSLENTRSLANENSSTISSSKVFPAAMQVVTVDKSKAYGTFNSHNQKVVANARGIFAAYIKDYNSSDIGTWQLRMSVDGGKTFAPILTQTDSSKAPCIETDSKNNIHIAYPTNNWKDIYYIKLLASENYTPPHSIIVSGAGAGKYSCDFRESDKTFFYVGWSNMVRINTDTMSVIDNRPVLAHGPKGYSQYPLLSFDPSKIYMMLGWTTVDTVGHQSYRDIRYGMSWNSGLTFGVPSTGATIRLPIVADSTGGSVQALLPSDDETSERALNNGSYINNWLANLSFVDGYIHFMYAHYGPNISQRVRYVRTSLMSPTPSVVMERFKGDSIELVTLGSYFITHRAPTGGYWLYAIGGTADNRIAALISLDSGETWHDFAASEPQPGSLYAVTGARSISPDGYIVGAATVTKSSTDLEIKFFKFRGYPGDSGKSSIK